MKTSKTKSSKSSNEEGSKPKASSKKKKTVKMEPEFLISEIIGVNTKEIRDLTDKKLKYYIKFEDCPYKDCQWTTYKQLSTYPNFKSLVNNFLKHEQPYIAVPFIKDLYKPATVPFEEEYLQPKKVIFQRRKEKEDPEYLILWGDNDLNKCTWSFTAPQELINKSKTNNHKINHTKFTYYNLSREIPNFQYVSLTTKFTKEYNTDNKHIESINWLLDGWLNHRNSIIIDENDEGRATQAVIFIEMIRKNTKLRGPYLILTTFSNMPSYKAKFKELTKFRTLTFKGSEDERGIYKDFMIYHFRKNGELEKTKLIVDVIITSYETLIKELRVFKKIEWAAVIMDEAQKAKNTKGITFKNCKMIPSDFIVLMTGEKTYQNIEDMYGLSHFLDNALFPEAKVPVKESTKKNKLSAIQFRESIRPYIYMVKNENIISEKLWKEEIIISVELTQIQRKLFMATIEDKKKEIFFNDRRSIEGLNTVTQKLIEVCNHPFLVENKRNEVIKFYQVANNINSEIPPTPEEMVEILIQSSGKLIFLDKFLPMLKEKGRKVTIFSQMTALLDILEYYLKCKGYSYERIVGSNQDEPKNNTDTFIFLLYIKAGYFGVSLTMTDTVILFDSDIKTQQKLLAQIEDENTNIESMKDVTIYRLFNRGTFESHFFERTIENGYLRSRFFDSDDIINEIDMDLRKATYNLLISTNNSVHSILNSGIETILDQRSYKIINDFETEENCLFPNEEFTPDQLRAINLEEFWYPIYGAEFYRQNEQFVKENLQANQEHEIAEPEHVKVEPEPEHKIEAPEHQNTEHEEIKADPETIETKQENIETEQETIKTEQIHIGTGPETTKTEQGSIETETEHIPIIIPRSKPKSTPKKSQEPKRKSQRQQQPKPVIEQQADPKLEHSSEAEQLTGQEHDQQPKTKSTRAQPQQRRYKMTMSEPKIPLEQIKFSDAEKKNKDIDITPLNENQIYQIIRWMETFGVYGMLNRLYQKKNGLKEYILTIITLAFNLSENETQSAHSEYYNSLLTSKEIKSKINVILGWHPFTNEKFVLSMFPKKPDSFVKLCYQYDQLFRVVVYLSNYPLPKNFEIATSQQTIPSWEPADDFSMISGIAQVGYQKFKNLYINEKILIPNLRPSYFWKVARTKMIINEVSMLIPKDFDINKNRIQHKDNFRKNNKHLYELTEISKWKQKQILTTLYLLGIPTQIQENDLVWGKFKALACIPTITDATLKIFVLSVIEKCTSRRPLLKTYWTFPPFRHFDLSWVPDEMWDMLARRLDFFYKIREIFTYMTDKYTTSTWNAAPEWWNGFYDAVLIKVTAAYGFTTFIEYANHIPSPNPQITKERIRIERSYEMKTLQPIVNSPTTEHISFMKDVELRYARLKYLIEFYREIFTHSNIRFRISQNRDEWPPIGFSCKRVIRTSKRNITLHLLVKGRKDNEDYKVYAEELPMLDFTGKDLIAVFTRMKDALQNKSYNNPDIPCININETVYTFFNLKNLINQYLEKQKYAK